jgi:hypothetical protein
LTNQPPADPHEPWKPQYAYDRSPSGDSSPGSGSSGTPSPESDLTNAPVSADPWSAPSGDALAPEPYPSPQPPSVPVYPLGYASLPQPASGPLPPTSQFPQQPFAAPQPYGQAPGYATAQPGYGQPQPGYGSMPPAPRKSNTPLVAVILAVVLLLCGGAVSAGILVVNNIKERTAEAIKPITDPTFPTEIPEMPELPTDLPDLPTGLPKLPEPDAKAKKITVVYEVTGDGPASIIYMEKLGDSPKRVDDATLPWRLKTKMQGAAMVSVTAVRAGTDTGTISCRATVDGEQVAQHTREGTFATVSCAKMIF